MKFKYKREMLLAIALSFPIIMLDVLGYQKIFFSSLIGLGIFYIYMKGGND